MTQPFCEICGINESIVATALGMRCWFHIPKVDEDYQEPNYICVFCGAERSRKDLQPTIMGWACAKECADYTHFKTKHLVKVRKANTVNCQECGTEIVLESTKGRKRKYCTPECQQAAYKRGRWHIHLKD